MIDLYIHRPPMKAILRAICRCHSSVKALEIVNKETGENYTEENIVQWKHIPEEEAIKEIQNLNSEKGR